MTLWSAGEIVKRLHGTTTRQILDLAEKGLIIPARETTGAGSPRLYDFRNIFEICLCLAVRGRIPAGTATQKLTANILRFVNQQIINHQERNTNRQVDMFEQPLTRPRFFEKPPFDLLLIAYDDHNNYSFSVMSYNETFANELRIIKKYRPQNYCTYILEVSALWKYLENTF